ncbi:alkane 1-monooxygenase [Pseudomonas sp. MAFF 730085]|uniref:Alkane 1-monooxygenase n=1 Tax=Pseudomonas kitaguniensis TaxID=2607908 RepID=A0A5N7K0C2_9PSED|nr:alkane 1-monooxygenase [Pseudomonas kitaguniensis]MPQ87099.1 alkane 1-monooxygenase [Pseudomonas kitaguniensis]
MNQTPATAYRWTDGKRHLWWLGILPLATPLLSGALAISTGIQPLWWVGVLVIFGVIPLIDGLLGEDRSNPPESAVSQLESQRYYRWIVYTGVLFVILSVVVTGWLAAGGIDWIINGGLLRASATLEPSNWPAQIAAAITARTQVHGAISGFTYLGMAMSTGAATGIAINTAHELGHKPKPLEVFLAKVTLAPTFYGHFYTEHNRGHHVRVATPEDPASSRLGESFWAFLPRSVWFSAVSACNLERERLRKLGLPALHWKNAVLSAWLYSVVLWGAMIAWLGTAVIPFLIIQALYGVSLLEVVNYVEHYGLKRQKLPNGRYERCSPLHSWNSNRIVTNIFLFQLQRHSDHHANPTRSYQSLRHFDESPQLPFGYASMIVWAYVPYLWRRRMDHRVVNHYGGDITLAHIQPSQRLKYLEKYSNRAQPF